MAVLNALAWGLLALLVSLLLSYVTGVRFKYRRNQQQAEEKPDRRKAA